MSIYSILIKIIINVLYSQNHIKVIKNQILPNTLKLGVMSACADIVFL